MKDKKIMGYEALLYALILMGCLIAVIVLVWSDINPQRSHFEMYFGSRPSQMEEGQNLSFSVVVKANDSQSPFVISVYFDDALQKTIRMIDATGLILLNFDMENDFKAGEAHKVEVRLYDENQPYSKYGSATFPYYIFFRVEMT